MKNRTKSIECCALLGLLTCLSCSSSPSGGSQGVGGNQTVGGASSTGTGGATSVTTAASTGGSVPVGGSVSTGGAAAPATGGALATGGKNATGGALATGGTNATGGAPAAGGESGAGGSPTGGKNGMGGTVATGGSNAGGPTGGNSSTGGASGQTATGGRTSTSTGGSTGASTGGGTSTSCSSTATAKPCPPSDAGSIAYIGCSMADNIGQGYGQVSGKIMWTNSGYGTGAMVVENWMVGGNAWSLYDTKLKAMGGIDKVKAIMVQICVLSTHSEANVKSMITAARAKVNPGTHIYIVGQPQYEAGHTCSLAGTGGAEWTDATAQKMANDSTVNQDLTYLGQFKLDTTKGESSDGCHASASGLTVLGNQAKAFWGG